MIGLGQEYDWPGSGCDWPGSGCDGGGLEYDWPGAGYDWPGSGCDWLESRMFYSDIEHLSHTLSPAVNTRQ